MDQAQLDDLKQRHRFDSWRNRDKLGENLVIRQFTFRGDELPGWRLHRAVRSEGEAVSVRSIWKRSDDELLAVDTIECPSRAAAHDILIETVGEFESTLLNLREQSTIGDVLFTMPGDTTVLFARANIVALLRNAGRPVANLTDVAGALDRSLIRAGGGSR